jgi:hypothetical protein
MKKLFYVLTALMFSAAAAKADYRLIVPQGPGAGTALWALVLAKNLEPQLGEKVIVENIPGINDIPGFNKFHNELRFDNKTIMVAHGGNAESYLLDKIDYDYTQYEPIATMSLNTVVTTQAGLDPLKDTVKMPNNSGVNADMLAVIQLVCGPQKDTDAYIDCFKKKIVYVKGMNPQEGRLAFFRNDVNTLRETFVAHKKFLQEKVDAKVYSDWFNHGVFDAKTGKIVPDRNFAGVPTFEESYIKAWKVKPSGEFYEAYTLLKNYRDVLQKALFVNKGNPNAEKLRVAIAHMANDAEAKKAFEAEVGNYDWFIGKDMSAVMGQLKKQITEKKLHTLQKVTSDGFGFATVYKPELAK